MTECEDCADHSYWIARVDEIESECDAKQRCFSQVLEQINNLHAGMSDTEIFLARHKLRATLLNGLGLKDIIA